MLVASDKLDCLAWAHADFAQLAAEEQQPAVGAVEDVIRPANPKVFKPEGFLFGKHRGDGPNFWQWFDRYEPRPADNSGKWSEPRLPVAF